MFILIFRGFEYYHIISLNTNPGWDYIQTCLSPEPCSPLRLLCNPEGVVRPEPSPCLSTSSDILTLRALSNEVRLEVGRDDPALTVMEGRSGNASDDATRDMFAERAMDRVCIACMASSRADQSGVIAGTNGTSTGPLCQVAFRHFAL